MLLSVIIFILFAVFAFENYSKAVLVYYPVSMLITTIPLVTVGATTVNLNTSLLLILYCLFFLRSKHDVALFFNKRYARSFIYFWPLLVLALGETLAFLLCTYGTPLNDFITIMCDFLFPFLLWTELKQKSIPFLLRSFALVSVIIVAYGCIEFVLQYNIWMEFLQRFTSVRLYVSHMDDFRFGFARCSSFFHFPIPFGDVCAVFFGLYLFMFQNGIKIIKRSELLFLMVAMVVGVLLSNSRAPIVMMILIVALQFKFKQSITNYIVLLTCGAAVVYFAGDFIVQNVNSILDPSVEDVSGSDVDMRLGQLDIAVTEFLNSPVFGAGYRRLIEISHIYDDSFGMESHLFTLMITSGLVGIVSYLAMYFGMFLPYPRKYRRFAFAVATAWVVGAVMSLTTGVGIIFPTVLLMIVYKLDVIKKQRLRMALLLLKRSCKNKNIN